MPNEGRCCVEPWVVGHGRTACCRFSMLGHHGVPRHTRDFDRVLRRMEDENIPQSSVPGGWLWGMFFSMWLPFGSGEIWGAWIFTDPRCSNTRPSFRGRCSWSPLDRSASGDHLCYLEHVQRDQRLATGGVSPCYCYNLFRFFRLRTYIAAYVHACAHTLHSIPLHYIMH